MTLSSLLLLCASPRYPGAECRALPKLGSTVTAFSTNLRTMFQDRSGDYWFGSHSEGVTRYDGKRIVRFTTKDGLPGDQVVDG